MSILGRKLNFNFPVQFSSLEVLSNRNLVEFDNSVKFLIALDFIFSIKYIIIASDNY